jgi:drug/metabolite transporter (DMT)-like permease
MKGEITGMNKRTESLSILMVLMAASLWGGIGVFVRILTAGGLDSQQMTAVRLCTTTIGLFFLLLIKDREKLKIRIKDLGWFVANGIFSICFFNTCYTACIQLTSMATAAVLLYTAPVFVMLISAMVFHEKLTGKKCICIGMSFFGCALVSGLADGAMTITPTGLMAGLGAGFGYALYSIFGSILIKKYEALTNIFYTFLFASVISLFMADMGNAVAIYQSDPGLLLINMLAGVMASALPYFLYTTALKCLAPSRASLIASIEPVVAAVLGFILYHERLSIFGYLGIVLVLGAVFWSNLPEKVAL